MKAIIPAAGLGTRWSPLSQYIPKELLPIGNRPAIHWVIGELINTGIKEIAVVINKRKEVIKQYLVDHFYKKVNMSFFYQDIPRGIGEAVLQCRDFLEKGPFCLALPDNIFIYKEPPQKQIMDIYLRYRPTVAFGVVKYKPGNMNLSSSFDYEEREKGIYVAHNFRNLLKDRCHRHGTLVGTGRYVMSPDVVQIWNMLKNKLPMDVELDDLVLFQEVEKTGNILGIEVKTDVYDTGVPEGWLRANLRLADAGKMIIGR